jgi:hypothetical protein
VTSHPPPAIHVSHLVSVGIYSGKVGEASVTSCPGPAFSLAFDEQGSFCLLCGRSQKRPYVEQEAKHEVALQPPRSPWAVLGILWENLPEEARPPGLKEVNDLEVGTCQADDATGELASTNNRDGTFSLKQASGPREVQVGPPWARPKASFEVGHLFVSVLRTPPGLCQSSLFAGLLNVLVWHNENCSIPMPRGVIHASYALEGRKEKG